jgi:hypothetical protein
MERLGEQEHEQQPRLTEAQETSLQDICGRYRVGYDPDHYHHTFDLPEAYVAGWVGGRDIQAEHPTIYCGVDPEGRISS